MISVFSFFAYSFWWDALKFLCRIVRECWCGVCVCSFRRMVHVATHAGMAWRWLGKIIACKSRVASINAANSEICSVYECDRLLKPSFSE
jgi:hypothetical protein